MIGSKTRKARRRTGSQVAGRPNGRTPPPAAELRVWEAGIREPCVLGTGVEVTDRSVEGRPAALAEPLILTHNSNQDGVS